MAAQYADAIGRRTVTAESGLAEGLVEQYAGSRQGNREEIRLREALKDANAEHFKSWLILVKVGDRAHFSRVSEALFSRVNEALWDNAISIAMNIGYHGRRAWILYLERNKMNELRGTIIVTYVSVVERCVISDCHNFETDQWLY